MKIKYSEVVYFETELDEEDEQTVLNYAKEKGKEPKEVVFEALYDDDFVDNYDHLLSDMETDTISIELVEE